MSRRATGVVRQSCRHACHCRCRGLSAHPLDVACLAFVLFVFSSSAEAEDEYFLSDDALQARLTHDQQWGDFGLDTAASAVGGVGSPLRIGRRTFTRGLGHHANGEIVVDLAGQFSELRATLGVQWQGGNKGSVVFRVLVDGREVLERGPMSDSDSPEAIRVDLMGAGQLRLVASDGGDGIGCDMANWGEARLLRDSSMPLFQPVATRFNGQPAPPPSDETCGVAMIASKSGPQVLLNGPLKTFLASVDDGEEVRMVIPVRNLPGAARISANVSLVSGSQVEVELSVGNQWARQTINDDGSIELTTRAPHADEKNEITLVTRGISGLSGVRWSRLRFSADDRSFPVPLLWPQPAGELPPAALPNARPSIERELIQWDWRMQDGIGTSREPSTWTAAIAGTIQRGDRLIDNLAKAGICLGELEQVWESCRSRWQAISEDDDVDETTWESLWRAVHECRRRIIFEKNPLAKTGPLLFVKRVPSSFSHQLTQYYGRTARPGGGIFVLDAPGRSMQCRQLARLPSGSCQHPEVSWDGRRVMFAFCATETAPADWHTGELRYYHLFEMGADGSGLHQLTNGPYDDFSPRYLPNGKILFLSTRRGGFHRCGRGPCEVYTMAVANADGSEPRVISFHETHEWDPAVLNDGRIIYTRWDYVDRHAVHYQQLWTSRPDGSNVSIFYGNNTLSPVGVWEARPIPGSNRIIATAGAHHAMTAGSIISLDVTRGIDGADPITRLTPDALFPESECRVGDRWFAATAAPIRPEVPVQQRRWPGHCYRTAFPLSEDYFLAAYSFAPLIGEPHANAANMFGIYLVDRFGNKELIYRDLSIGSLWPTPLRPRQKPPILPSLLEEAEVAEGTFFVQNVNDSWPSLPDSNQTVIRRLRIVQVLPKTTPHSNTPRVGLANASPGKQVLGTVPVEPDGSAYFRAPAGIPLAFQALDEQGMAVQTMRSLTYLQPGEHTACVGCHEHRNHGPDVGTSALARTRPPSTIAPGPDGAKPFSYPLLVQPVLDRHCVDCHSGADAEGDVILTDEPAGSFTRSYNALAPWVSYSEWKSTPAANWEPMTPPDHFGARASRLTALLREGHEGVSLSDADWERLATWMDVNALFYGTFDPEDQRRQQLGQRIAGPGLE